jgi:hypothetical protein
LSLADVPLFQKLDTIRIYLFIHVPKWLASIFENLVVSIVAACLTHKKRVIVFSLEWPLYYFGNGKHPLELM